MLQDFNAKFGKEDIFKRTVGSSKNATIAAAPLCNVID